MKAALNKGKVLLGLLIALCIFFAIEVMTIITLKTSPDSAISNAVYSIVNSFYK